MSIKYLSNFTNPAVHAAVIEAKFYNNSHAQDLLAALVQDYIHTYNADVIIPMPLSTVRYKERGYNQIESILDRGKIPYINTVLIRSHTKPQTSLSRHERLHNVARAFTLTDNATATLAGKHIILIDDVVTTGATLHAAYTALIKASPSKITLLALAH